MKRNFITKWLRKIPRRRRTSQDMQRRPSPETGLKEVLPVLSTYLTKDRHIQVHVPAPSLAKSVALQVTWSPSAWVSLSYYKMSIITALLQWSCRSPTRDSDIDVNSSLFQRDRKYLRSFPPKGFITENECYS